MSEQAHTKDWYVAQVVVLDNENKRLKNEAELQREKIIWMKLFIPFAFCVGYFLARLLWRLFP